MYPVLFQIGDVTVRTYTVLIDLGLLVGLGVAFALWRRRGGAPGEFLDLAAVTLLGGVLGGRAWYVATNWSYFSVHLQDSISIWMGGSSFHGAFLGGILANLLYALITRRSFWPNGDIIAAGIAAGGIFG
jgi:phosphatidylglycerol---prolipoprotein diacylglyceryl transferase